MTDQKGGFLWNIFRPASPVFRDDVDSISLSPTVFRSPVSPKNIVPLPVIPVPAVAALPVGVPPAFVPPFVPPTLYPVSPVLRGYVRPRILSPSAAIVHQGLPLAYIPTSVPRPQYVLPGIVQIRARTNKPQIALVILAGGKYLFFRYANTLLHRLWFYDMEDPESATLYQNAPIKEVFIRNTFNELMTSSDFQMAINDGSLPRCAFQIPGTHCSVYVYKTDIPFTPSNDSVLALSPHELHLETGRVDGHSKSIAQAVWKKLPELFE